MIQRLQKKRDEGGFTLIELLIVIIVLAILAAIVVFAVSSTRSDSVHSACKTDYKSLELSAEAVNTKMGSYPTTASVNGAATVSGVTTITPVAAGTNQLLAGNTAGPSTTNNGAILKAWPSNTNYQLYYQGVGTPPSSFTITVYKSVANGGTALGGASPSVSDCDSL